MRIYITEDKLLYLSEQEEERVTFYKFFTEVKNFIRSLLDDPINAKPSSFFKEHKISRSLLINKMLDRNIITKRENIDEPKDADGKIQSKHYLQYNVPRKNFEQKIKRLYSYFFENEKRKNNINETKLSKYNSVATYIFCKDESGKMCVLGGKRRGYNNSGRYNVPTGLVGDNAENENELEAAVREVREESGLNIPPSLFKDAGSEEYDNVWGHQVGKNYVVVLSGTTSDNAPGKGDGENDRFKWIPLEAVDVLDWAFNMNNTIKRIVSYIQ